MRSRKYVYYCLTIPALLLMAAFIALPLGNSVRLSFYKWNGYSQHMRWVGLNNFIKIASDQYFLRTVGNTLIYGIGSTILQNVTGLMAALFLNKRFAGRNSVRVILYMPIMISGFIMGQILYYFVQYDGGVFNEILQMFGGQNVYWMGTGLSATAIITLVNSWQYMGISMLIYLAGLQNIPVMYREAARLDGAGVWKEFTNVTLPLLIPAITTAVILNLIGGLKLYDVIVSMSNGGPNRASMSLSFYISVLYFNDAKAGYSSALSIVTFQIIMVLSWGTSAWLHKKEVEY